MFEAHLIRWYLKPRVVSDLPGRLRLSFEHFRRLPRQALPYLHYVEDVFQMIDGVRDVRVNPQIGTLLILYDASLANSRQLLDWIDTVVQTGIQIAMEADGGMPVDEATLQTLAKRRLSARLNVTKAKHAD